jgi:hypothetical protein
MAEETENKPRRREMSGMTPMAKKEFFNQIRDKVGKEVKLHQDDEDEAVLMAWSFPERPLDNLEEFVLALGIQGSGRGLMRLYLTLGLALKKNMPVHLDMLARAVEAIREEEVTEAGDIPDFIENQDW